MRTIVHLSDLHFGRVYQPTLQPLILAVSEMKPDLVAVSGDLTHHPFDLPEGFADIDLVGRARMAMSNFGKCGVDLFLAGHLHETRTGSAARYKIQGYFALVIQAGTATSTRGRGELNSFNLIRIDPPQITVETHAWQPDRHGFAISQTTHFRRSEDGWISI